jgi:hypothetical protein
VAAAREKLQLSMPSKLFGWVSLEQAPTRERKLCVCCWENNNSSGRKEKNLETSSNVYSIYFCTHKANILLPFQFALYCWTQPKVE